MIDSKKVNVTFNGVICGGAVPESQVGIRYEDPSLENTTAAIQFGYRDRWYRVEGKPVEIEPPPYIRYVADDLNTIGLEAVKQRVQDYVAIQMIGVPYHDLADSYRREIRHTVDKYVPLIHKAMLEIAHGKDRVETD